MKIRPYINFIASVFLLSACVNSVEETAIRANFTVGDEDNEIVLMAGVRDGGTSVTTRAADPGHSNHTPFISETKMALRIDGTWLEHDPVSISKPTTATITTNTVKDDKHNKVSFGVTENGVTEKCYWDDYGTADPANMNPNTGNGRDQGLTIYAACVEGASSAPTISSWTSHPWSVGTPTSGVINQTGGWANVDLLTSNNITSSADGTYKFDEWMNTSGQSPAPEPSNILIFTHAMTQITVELTAGLGFVDNKFAEHPTVTLLGFNYTGTVDVVEKTSTPTDNSVANINMHRSSGGASSNKATFDALVFPGNTFGDGTDILTLTADGNTYFVTAAKLNEAIQTAITKKATTGYPGTDNSLLQGWNYKLRITVNQSDIVVTATILNWKEVEADTEAPKINFSQCYGQDGTNFGKDFTLYRSKTVTGSYITEDNSSTVSYASSKYTMSPQLYWPDHQTHYFFRGVWPVVDSKDTSAEPQQLGPTSSQVKASYVEVANVEYKEGYYPSDLMIGIPRKADGTFDEVCKAGHKTGENATAGICATDAAEGGNHTNNNEGLIHLNFEYAMSQVEVELKTVDSPDAAKVNINANTVVELVNVYNSGEVKLSDGFVTTSGEKSSYTLNPVTGEPLKRHSAIVPQSLTFTEKGATTNLRFKITVTNDDAVLYANATEYNAAKGTSIDDDVFAALTDEQKTKTPATTDVYYADVEPILKSDKTGKVAPNGKWESGVHYKYILTLSKTAIKVTATLKDWVTVTASDNIWF